MRPLIAILLWLAATAAAQERLSWPTESKEFANGAPYAEFIQPTASGAPESGLFGDVRNGGYKFHEGIDIKSVRRDRKGEPLDDILCAMDGVVKCVNRIGGNSGYGRYIVVSHPQLDVEVYTLYAHLAEIDAAAVPGAAVKSGQRLGKMGRSANYGIGKQQAHLHFEIGLRISDSFETWYRSKRYKERNFFGNYNGMNLTGFDPLEFFQKAAAGKISNGIAKHISDMPTAFVARVYTKKTPDFAKMYPALCDMSGHSGAWDIHMTWFGLIKKMERPKEISKSWREGDVEIIKVNPAELNRKCRKMLIKNRKGEYKPNEAFKEFLRAVFI
ncbi:MAG: M23 family peptidase [Verrucomicrobia bacterium]|nr:MAG: M23 family peptidase [Verrucomicrobiota bacterium]